MNGFIAVHAGAGYHLPQDRKILLDVCKLACEKGCHRLLSDKNAVDACAIATVVLEDSPLTNAGLGSNLNISKFVECDAGIMDGATFLSAGCGAVPRVKNPILIPFEMLKMHASIGNNSKLVHPLIISGQGAYEFAKHSGIVTVNDDDLITTRCLKDYENCLKSIEKRKNYRSNMDEIHLDREFSSKRLDTVGCIAVDSKGNVAASCSSGGILLKQQGRIGHGAIFGCGCWAENTDKRSVAVSVSGCGEYLMQTRFAQSCAQSILENVEDEVCLAQTVENFFAKDFVSSKFLRNADETHKIAGAIILVVDHLDDKKFCTEFLFVHNSPTFLLSHSGSTDQVYGLLSKSKNGKIVVCGKMCK